MYTSTVVRMVGLLCLLASSSAFLCHAVPLTRSMSLPLRANCYRSREPHEMVLLTFAWDSDSRCREGGCSSHGFVDDVGD